jgi:uncharacterized protein YjbI with pentapeptide repeats
MPPSKEPRTEILTAAGEDQTMSEKAHLALLKHGVNGWNEWRNAHAETRPELSNASLCGLDLANANLAGADLRKADLRGANLNGATLSGANLEGADFFKAVLDGADLAGANLVGARFLSCPQLVATRNWQSAFRDAELACGAPIPSGLSRS